MVHVHPWTNVLVRASMKMEADAIQKNWVAANTPLAKTFLDRLKRYYQQRDRDQIEGTTLVLLRSTLDELQQKISDVQIKKMLGIFYAKTRENWIADPAAIDVLKILSANGYELGILSNAADHDDVLELVKGFGFDKYIQKVTTSAHIGFRKPHPDAFRYAINRFGWSEKDITMVGDRYDADIKGANEVGLPAVWVNRNNDVPQDLGSMNKVITDLSQLIQLL